MSLELVDADQALSFRGRVVQHSLCDNVLKPYFEKRLIYDCAACRENKGTHFAMNRLSGFMKDFYRKHGIEGYFLKCDVRKYFDNIDHDVLKYLLRRFPDNEVRFFLYQIIDSYHPDTGKVIRRLRTSSKHRLKRRLRAFQRQYRAGKIELDNIRKSLASYDGHLQHGHTWRLKTKLYRNFILTKASEKHKIVKTGDEPEKT